MIEITVDNTGRSINRFSMSKIFVASSKSLPMEKTYEADKLILWKMKSDTVR
jgi:hypothetical protein